MRLGIDVGGTKTDAVVLDDELKVLERLRVPTGYGSAAVVASTAGVIRELSARVGLHLQHFRSIGLGVPGVVDPQTGSVSHAVNLGFRELHLSAVLERELAVRVHVENDVNAAALGAYRLVCPGGSLAYLSLGTGLAAGFVVDGKLLRGSRGAAGEIGHISVDPAGTPCSCGQIGCLESIASGSGMARAQAGPAPVPIAELFERGDRGDEVAQRLAAQLAQGVAAAVRTLVLTVDVETVVIGGGLSRLGQRLMDEVGRALTDSAAASPFLASLELPARVQLVPPDAPVTVVGAALAAVSTAASQASLGLQVQLSTMEETA